MSFICKTILLAPLLALGACAAKPIAPASSIVAPLEGYRLDAGDKIRVGVFGEPDLSGDFQIGDDGRIQLPLAGGIKLSGLQLPEAEAALTQLLGGAFVRNPQVSLALVSARPFYILGEIKSPGEYPYSSGMTVLNAVAKAGGFTYRANQRTVFLRRKDATEESRTPLTVATTVQPGDTIRVVERIF